MHYTIYTVHIYTTIGRRHGPAGPRLHRAHPVRPHREVLAQGKRTCMLVLG